MLFSNARSIKAVLLALALMLTACAASYDKQVFRSTEDLPTTVEVYEPLTGNSLWTKDIPVGHTLSVDFNGWGDIGPFAVRKNPATSMKWKLSKTGSFWPVESDKIDLPGRPVSTKVTYRPRSESQVP